MWWLLGCLGLVLAWWGILSTRRILYPPRAIIPPPELLHNTVHSITGSEGASFDVWLLAPQHPKARILVCHGYYANCYQVFAVAHALRQRGYEAILFDMRGHGNRPGPYTFGIKETGDALAALQWAQHRPAAQPLPVGVLGFSMGAAVMCHVAFRDSQIQAVVADSLYSRLFPILQEAIWERYHLPAVPFAWVTWWSLQLALGKRLSRMDPLTLAPHLRQSLFAIHGGEDRRVPLLMGETFYERWAGPKERWVKPNIAHVRMFAMHPEEYIDRVASFFDRALR